LKNENLKLLNCLYQNHLDLAKNLNPINSKLNILDIEKINFENHNKIINLQKEFSKDLLKVSKERDY